MANNSTIFNLTQSEPTRFKIDTRYFTPNDLDLFVDCLETITRVTREKAQRKEQEKLQELNKAKTIFPTMPRISSVTTLNSLNSDEEEALEDLNLKENKSLPHSPAASEKSDENYISASSSGFSTPRRDSGIYKKELFQATNQSMLSVLTISDSEESGIFPTGSPQHDLYVSENTPLKKRSPSFCTKMRLSNLIKKRDSVKQANVKLVSLRALDEYETLEVNEQQQKPHKNEEVPQVQKLASFYATFRIKRKPRLDFVYTEDTSQERFIDKALRYLTL